MAGEAAESAAAKPSEASAAPCDPKIEVIVPIPAPSEAQEEGRRAEQEEIRDLEAAQRRIDHDRARALIAGYQADVALRKWFAPKVAIIGSSWIALLLVVVLLQGFGGFAGYPFALDKEVMIALVGGATANVLGMFWLVVRNLFPKRDLQIEPPAPSE